MVIEIGQYLLVMEGLVVIVNAKMHDHPAQRYCHIY